MEKLVLTGIGPVAPVGIGKEPFWNTIVTGVSGVKRLTKISTMSEEHYCGEVSNFNFDEYVSDGRFRRVADVSKYTLAAVSLAIQDAGVRDVSGSGTALVAGITHGALNYAQTFHRSLVKEGADDISPIHFSESVLNAPAGNTSIGFGIKGPVHTLVGGATTALKAIMLACQMLESGVVDKSIVVSADEINEFTLHCYSRLGVTILAEGSGAILIEKEADIKEKSPYCYVSGMASQCNPSNPDTSLTDVMNRCLEKAGLSFKDIALVMTDSLVTAEPGLNTIPAGCIIPLTGNAFSLTTMWHIIVSSLVIKNGTIPKSVVRNAFPTHDAIRNVMICSKEEQGMAAAVILSKW
ncbi:MAG: beta-ketoacyl synthase N-terminal-like domain-containing protein [Planctomycetota bacterium]